MANGIADIDEDSVHRGHSERPREQYDRLGGVPFNYSSESSEYSWSDCSCSSSWCSCESEEYSDCCCCCSGTCQEGIWMGGGRALCDRGCGGGRSTCREPVQAAQGCTVIQNNHSQNKSTKQAREPRPKDVRSPESLEWERGLRMEDVIYYLAKRERHRNDEQRRIQDWMRVMGDLEGDDSERRGRQARDERYRDVDMRERSQRGRHVDSAERNGFRVVDSDDCLREHQYGLEPRIFDGRRESRPRESPEKPYEYGSRYWREESRERARGGRRFGDVYGGFRRR